MSAAFPAAFADLLDDGTRAYLMLATTTSTGAPLVSPVWFVAEAGGGRLVAAVEPGSLKALHVQARPGVAGVLVEQGDLVRYVHVRGVARIEDDPARRAAVYARIVRRYEGAEAEPTATGSLVLLEIAVERATGFDYHGWDA